MRSEVFLEDHTFLVRKLADGSMGHEMGVRDRKGSAGRSNWNAASQALPCPVGGWQAGSS